MSRTLSFRHMLTPKGIVPERRLVLDDAGAISAIEPSSGADTAAHFEAVVRRLHAG